MKGKRKYKLSDIVDYRHVLISVVLCLILLIYQIHLLRDIPILILAPLLFLSWDSSTHMLINLRVILSHDDIVRKNKNYKPLKTYPDIAFILPSYHEPFEVAKMTFDSIYNLDYKGIKEVIVVDNSKDIDSKDFKDWKEYVNSFIDKFSDLKVKFIHNEKHDELKPGNLDLAQEYIENSEYVVIVDIDSTFLKDAKILEKSIAEFDKDEYLGWIQFTTKPTNHHFNPLSRAIGAYQNLMRTTCFFKSMGGFALFYGHNGIWRKSCLTKLGRWFEKYKGQTMVTEDILKTVLAYGEGYYGKSIPFDTGEWVPNSLNALESMWLRWTFGTCQVMSKYFKMIIRTKGMTFLEKYDLWHHILSYWGCAISIPMAIVFILLFSPKDSSILISFLFILPQVLNGVAMYKLHIKNQPVSTFRKFIDFYAGAFIVYGYVAIVQLKGIFNYLFNADQGWKVTQKGVEDSGSWYSIIAGHRLHIAFSILLIGASILSWQLNSINESTKLIYYLPAVFLSLNLFMSFLFFGKSGRIKSNSIHSSTIDFFTKANFEDSTIEKRKEAIQEPCHTFLEKDKFSCSEEVV